MKIIYQKSVLFLIVTGLDILSFLVRLSFFFFFVDRVFISFIVRVISSLLLLFSPLYMYRRSDCRGIRFFIIVVVVSLSSLLVNVSFLWFSNKPSDRLHSFPLIQILGDIRNMNFSNVVTFQDNCNTENFQRFIVDCQNLY